MYCTINLANNFNSQQSFVQDFSRIVKIKLIDLANSELDKIYLYLWNIREATDNPAFYYYAFENGNFVQVVKVINPDLSYQYQLRIQLYTFPVNCSICPSPSVATNSSIRYAFPIDEATGLPDLRTVSIKEQLVYFAPIRPFYTLCKGKNTPQWLTPTPFSTPGTFGVTVCQGMNNRDGTISGVFAMNIQLSQLSFLFRSLRKTSTSFVYVLASDGTVVATSTGQNLAPNGPILKINSITDTEVKKTSSYLQETYPETKTNWASLTQLNIFSLNDTLFQTNQLQFENFKCLIVNGALRKDYVGDIDETLINLTNDLTKNTYMIIGIAIGTFVILVTFGVFFTYFAITRPLQSITRIMVAATKFEFTALKDKELVTRRSFISEFASMESSFFKMVKNFADSISNNRKLMGKSQSIGQGSNNGVNSTVLGSGGERRGSADMLRRPSEDPAPYRFMQGGRRPSRVDL